MKKTFVILYLTLVALTLQGQVIPDSLRVDWPVIKEHFHFTEPARSVSIIDFGGVGDGQTDNVTAVNAALSQTSGSNYIIYFPAGVYLFSAPILLHDSVTLKGEGAGLTTLLFDFNKQNLNGINIAGSASNLYVLLDGGYEKSSNKIFSDSAFMFNKGQVIEISEQNGNWDIKPISWADNSVGQLTVIDSIAGDTLFLQSPLRITYLEILTPKVRVIKPMVNTGISCLKLKRVDIPPSGGGNNIYLSNAQNCRVNGVESFYSVGSHLYVTNSLSVSVTGSYFHHSFEYDGASTHGYGVTLNHHTSECLIENNIFEHLRHAMMVKTGANGNVFGYNYSTDVYRSEPIHTFSGDISLHGHFAYANLFEGNIVQNIMIDHYWGPSGPFNTLFRNRAELWGIIMTNNELLETSRQNFVGNETTDLNPFYGQYTLSGSNHFEYGNNIVYVITPDGTDSLPDSSYYLSEKPAFWDVPDSWPSVGIPNNLGSGSNPARERFLSGDNYTVCIDSTLTDISAKGYLKFKVKVWPNPGKGVFYIAAQENIGELMIFNITGLKVFESALRITSSPVKIDTSLPPGVYMVVVSGKQGQGFAKIVIYE